MGKRKSLKDLYGWFYSKLSIVKKARLKVEDEIYSFIEVMDSVDLKISNKKLEIESSKEYFPHLARFCLLKWNLEILQSIPDDIKKYLRKAINDVEVDTDIVLLPILGQYSIPECRVESGDIVFDCGAYIGEFSIYAILSRAKVVYAFEPTEKAFDYLKKLEKILPNLVAIKKAVFSENGFKPYSTFPIARYASIQNFGNNKVECVKLDDFVCQEGIKKVDFIKMDIEGSEREAIKGAEEIIKKFKPKMAIAAYHLPDDREKIPELVLSIRPDYKFKIVRKGEEDLFFF